MNLRGLIKKSIEISWSQKNALQSKIRQCPEGGAGGRQRLSFQIHFCLKISKEPHLHYFGFGNL